MSLTTCLKRAGKALNAEDKNAILEAARVNRKAGMSADQAAKAAVQAQIDKVQALIAQAQPQVSTWTPDKPATLKERAAAMAAKGQPVHQDPGEAPEVATKAVVTEAIKTAADNRDRKPSEMRAELLRMIDQAIAQATDESVLDAEISVGQPITRMGKKEISGSRRFADGGNLSLEARQSTDGAWTVTDISYDGSGTGKRRNKQVDRLVGGPAAAQEQLAALLRRMDATGKVGEPDTVTLKVPGDGTFKILNTKQRLEKFRAQVESSPGFKDRQPRPALEDAAIGAQRGSGGPKAVIENMIDEGDPQAAVDYAAARGLVIADVLKGDKVRLPKVAGLTPTAEAVGEFEPEVSEAAPASSPAPAAQPVAEPPETTDAQRLQAEDHAKDLGGRVVWQRGDLALVEGYSLLSGDSVYIAANGSQRTRVDIRSYTGGAFTETQKVELLEARADAVKAAEAALARNPDGPFKAGPLVFADDIPANVQGVVRGWIGLLGLDGARIVVTTPKSGAAMADGMAGKFRRIGKASLSGDNTNGTMQPLGGDDFHIAVRPNVSTLKTLEVLAHELGHIVERRAFAQADTTTQQAIREAHAKWLKENGGGRALDMAQAMRAYRSGQTTGFSEGAKAAEAGAYWRSFGEWFADQVSRWATTQDKPVSVVEQFFKRLADRLRAFFTGERAKFRPDATVSQWLDSLSKGVPPTDEVVAEPPAQAPADAAESAAPAPAPSLRERAEGMRAPKRDGDMPVFSRASAKLEQERDLIIQHNLTVENLMHAARMGGIPVPSLAVTKADSPLVNFGEITLIGPQELADPKGYAGTKVFGADIYSPRYPNVTLDFTPNQKRRLEAELAEAMKATDERYIDYSELAKGPRELSQTVPFLWKFAKDNGITPEVVRTAPKPIQPGLEAYQNDTRPSHELAADPEFQAAAWASMRAILLRANKGDEAATDAEMADRRGNVGTRGRDIVASNAAYEVERYRREVRDSGKVDRYATRTAIENQLRARDLMGDGMIGNDGKMLETPRLEQAARDMIQRIGPNERIFRGFSYSGNRLYTPHTLENVVKILKKELRGGESFNYGMGSLRAKFTPQFKSVKAIREAKDRLVTKERFDQIKKEMDAEMMALSDSFGHKSLETTLSMVEDAAKMGVDRAAKEYDRDAEVTPEQRQAVYEFIGKLRNLPTEYFEAKVLREVDLAEFKVAVVPANTPKAALDYLASRGVKIETYERGNDTDRAAKIKAAADKHQTLFSRTGPTFPAGFVSPRLLSAEVSKITANWDTDLATVKVVNRVEDLPDAIRQAVYNVGAENQVRGLAMPTGEVYLVAENIGSVDEGRFVLFHEVYGHVGMRAFLGDGYSLQMRTLKAANPALAREADKWFKSFGEAEIQARIDVGMSPLKARQAVNDLAVEEALADRAGNLPAIKGWQRLMAALQRALRRMGLGSVADMLEGMSEAETLALLVDARATVSTESRGGMQSMTSPVFQRAYHGTAARGIKRFSTDYMGTGEGAQAYGWGLYFAGKREVADYYREALSKPQIALDGKPLERQTDDFANALRNVLRQTRKGVPFNAAIADEARILEASKMPSKVRDAAALRKLSDGSLSEVTQGQTYEVEIPEDSEMLLWDQPVRDMPEAVREAIYGAAQGAYITGASGERRFMAAPDANMTGGAAYARISRLLGGDMQASKALMAAGVKGIKYLDGTSRGAGDGTFNYVVFSGDDVAIREQQEAMAPAFSRAPQTDTKAFRDWFGDSKVVDAEGKPLVVYHGTDADFSVFDRDKTGKGPSKLGFWFTDLPDFAENFGGTMMPAYVAVSNPKRLSRERWDAIRGKHGGDPAYFSKMRDDLVAQGFDGVMVKGGTTNLGRVTVKEPAVIAAFRPEQIKSAIGNRGTFDPTNADIRFSRTALRDAIPPGVQEWITDRTTSQRGFNRIWHRTVGTQLHKAKTNKEFGRAYYAVQDFMKDVSRMATLAAEKAPDMLPQIETLGDLARLAPTLASPAAYKQRKADIKAASDALFDGTLRYTRDEEGRAVKVDPDSDELGGIVWTAAELKARGLSDRAVKMYQQSREAIDQSLDSMLAADLYRQVSVMDPELVARDPGDYKALMEGLRKAAASDTPGDAVQALRGAIKDRLDDVQSALDGQPNQFTPGLMQRRQDLRKLQGMIGEKVQRIEDLKAAGYAPLMRFGPYAVDVVNREGRRVFFGMYESQAAANKAARNFQGDGLTVTQSVMPQKQFEALQGVSPETAMLFAEMLGVEKNEAMQVWLKNAVAEQSALKRHIRRKGIEGFDEDGGRVLAAFITSNARAASRALHTQRITEAVENIRQGDVQDEARALAEYVSNPKEEAQAIRSLLFVQYIGGSIASAIVNLTQTVVQTFPFLSQYGGAGKAGARIGGAVKAALAAKIADPELAAAVARAEKEGVIKPQEVFQLQAEASRNLGSNLYARSILAAWGSMFQLAEVFNRRVAFIAAYNTAKAEGIANPFAFAENAVDETQSVFNKGNRPNWSRGAVGATLFTFKTFTIQYVEFLKRLATAGEPGSPERARGQKAAALALMSLVLLAGMKGLPFAEDAEDLIDTVAQALGYNWTTDAQIDKWLNDTMGEVWADIVQHGMSGVPGVPFDVSQRLGMANLLPGTGLLKQSETNKQNQVLEVFGVAGSAVRDATQGQFLPIAIRNLMIGLDTYETGLYRDRRGRAVTEADPLDAALKAIGLQPNNVARAQRDIGRQIELRSLYQAVKEEITDAWAQARFAGDTEGIERARASLKRWNDQNPEARIIILPRTIEQRVMQMRRSKAERTIANAPRPLRASTAEALE